VPEDGAREAPSRPFGHTDLTERRTLIEGLIDSVRSYSDQLTVQVVGAPPIVVALDEVGPRGGIKTVSLEVVSEASSSI
jgi:hypothetical protein